MSASTIINRRATNDETLSHRIFQWQGVVTVMLVIALFGIGVWMRLRDLGLPVDRDGYDEGVYWQSLRAMSAGHHLYQDIFYSQPPLFLLSIFPSYMLFGQTLWAARLGIALISLLGLLGAFLLGYGLSGRLGGLVALLLLVVNPLYLAQSQTLQAEGPSVAFSLLAVACAYLWWKKPGGARGMLYAVLAGTTLACSILCKLLAVTILVPVSLLFIISLWHIFQQQDRRLIAFRSALAGASVLLIAITIFILPFMGVHSEFVRGVITFHIDAGRTFRPMQKGNLPLLQSALTTWLTLAAIYGGVVALLRRDWRVIPLVAWLLATVLVLWMQVPLFPHHLIALVPPLIALTVMGIGPVSFGRRISPVLYTVLTGFTIMAVLVVAVIDWNGEQYYYHKEQAQSVSAATKQDAQVAHDLESFTQPGQFVITDAQFIVGLADRSTPPESVDTSGVRIGTGYITAKELIQEASQSQVHAVLFYTYRLDTKKLVAFKTWVKQHFRFVHGYGSDRELWVKM